MPTTCMVSKRSSFPSDLLARRFYLTRACRLASWPATLTHPRFTLCSVAHRCLFEVAQCCMPKNPIKFELAVAPSERLDFCRALQQNPAQVELALTAFDARSALASVPEDKEAIMNLIETTFSQLQVVPPTLGMNSTRSSTATFSSTNSTPASKGRWTSMVLPRHTAEALFLASHASPAQHAGQSRHQGSLAFESTTLAEEDELFTATKAAEVTLEGAPATTPPAGFLVEDELGAGLSLKAAPPLSKPHAYSRPSKQPHDGPPVQVDATMPIVPAADADAPAGSGGGSVAEGDAADLLELQQRSPRFSELQGPGHTVRNERFSLVSSNCSYGSILGELPTRSLSSAARFATSGEQFERPKPNGRWHSAPHVPTLQQLDELAHPGSKQMQAEDPRTSTHSSDSGAGLAQAAPKRRQHSRTIEESLLQAQLDANLDGVGRFNFVVREAIRRAAVAMSWSSTS